MLTSKPFQFFRRIGFPASPRIRGTVTLVIPVLCTITIFSAWMITRNGARNAEQWVNQTERIIADSNIMLLKVTNLESQVRQYAITGQSGDDQIFNQDRQVIQQLSQTVYQNLAENPVQQRKWSDIQTTTQQRLDILATFLDQLETSLFPGEHSISPTVLKRGQGAMDDLKQSLQSFQAQERHLLALRKQQLNQRLQASVFVAWSLLGVSLFSSISAIYLCQILDSERTGQDLELDQNQQLIKAIADAVSDGIIMIDRNYQVQDFNQAARAIFEYQDTDVQGRKLHNFLQSFPTETLRSDDDGKTSPQILETLGKTSSGKMFPVEISLHPVHPNQHQLLIVRDISERQAVQQKLKADDQALAQLNLALSLSNQTLNRRNQELNHFAYLASHDLKAPLRAITTLSEWIEDDLHDKLPPENRRQFELLRNRAKRLGGLIDALALYAQIGQRSLNSDTIPVGDLVHQIIAEQAVPTHIQINISPDLPTLQADRAYLKEVFLQLINNAIKFHQGTTGTIEIRAQGNPQGWEFIVSDDGPGIDPAFHDKIFDVFQTLTPRDQRESKGIGLAIVTKILNTIGGEIHLISSPGNGATFHFTWPNAPHPSSDGG